MYQREPDAKPGFSVGDKSASRREFLTGIPGAAAAITLASAAAPVGSSAAAGAGDGTDRAGDSYEVREEAARAESRISPPRQIPNGDEQQYPTFIGNYSKGLPHNNIGEVDPQAYRSLVNALGQGTAAALERVTLGGDMPLVNPLAGLAFDLEGSDSHKLAIPPFPKLASRALADQAVELYWMALCRDVNFTAYGSQPLPTAAVAELSTLPAPFAGVTAQTLFRAGGAGLIGPYVSQLLLKPFSYGPYAMGGLMSVAAAGKDYLVDLQSWLASQNGHAPFPGDPPDPTPRAIRNGRDLASYVHNDPNAGLFMSFYNAGIFLFENGAPLNPGNPYRAAILGGYRKQAPFGTFGLPFFLGLIGEAATRAFKAAWYAKWFVHRALRPDQYGGLVHLTITGKSKYPLDRDILSSSAAANVFTRNAAYFLPQAYPEAGPQHPSYPSGHATMAGACATMLKAAFDGNAAFASLTNSTIQVAADDGRSLTAYSGADAGQITLNGEIDKLASNIGLGRNFAGIHWRADFEQGLRLGEAVAISILRDQRNNNPGEEFDGFIITTFDGNTIRV